MSRTKLIKCFALALLLVLTKHAYAKIGDRHDLLDVLEGWW